MRGSGGRTPEQPEQLSAGEQAAVRKAQVEIQSYCRELTLYLARRRGPPTEDETGRATARGPARRDRTREAGCDQRQSGRTVRELLGDIAEDLEGSNCAQTSCSGSTRPSQPCLAVASALSALGPDETDRASNSRYASRL